MDAWVRWHLDFPGVVLVSLLEAPAWLHSASLGGTLHAGHPDPWAKDSQRPPWPPSQGTSQWEKGKRVPGERATVLGENARSKG